MQFVSILVYTRHTHKRNRRQRQVNVCKNRHVVWAENLLMYFISQTIEAMFKVWDKVKVKTWLVNNTKHGIIECTEDHLDAMGMEWEIIQVFGEWQGYILSFDPWLTFSEDMLDLVEQATVKEVKQVVQQPTVPVGWRRTRVHERLEKYVKMINKLEEVDRDMFFWMIYDKLESILFEEYGD